jgi:hypothetical protein
MKQRSSLVPVVLNGYNETAAVAKVSYGFHETIFDKKY